MGWDYGDSISNIIEVARVPHLKYISSERSHVPRESGSPKSTTREHVVELATFDVYRKVVSSLKTRAIVP